MLNKSRIARALLVPFGLGGLLWGSFSLPTFRALAPAQEVTKRIMAYDRFKLGALAAIRAQLEAYSNLRMQHPDAVRARALVDLRVSEEMMGRNGPVVEIDGALEAAGTSVRSSLELTPADSFLWLMLYSVETMRNGFNPCSIEHLDQSYALGPYEGWIALRRNRLALSIFSMLNEVGQQKAIAEFAAILDSNFIEQAELNLTSVGWEQREQLLAGLERVDITSREAFAKRLARDGVKVSVPGVELDERWQR